MKTPTIPLSILRKKNKSPTHHVLADDKAFTDTGWGIDGTTGSDNSEGTANGGTAILRVSQISGDVYSFTVDHGDPGYAYDSALASFTIDGTTIASEQVEITGDIKQATDLHATKLSGTNGAIKVTCTLVRN
jgi:hypothetical protein